MKESYYQDKWVTIYHLTSLPKRDKLSLDKCMEVGSCLKRRPEDIGQGKEVRMFPNEALAQRRDTSNQQGIYKSGSDLGQNTTRIKARISLLNLGEVELYADIRSNLAKDVAIQRLRDTIRMAMREIITQRISNSYVADATCLRMGD